MDKELCSVKSGWNYLSIRKIQQRYRWNLGINKLSSLTLYNGGNYLLTLILKVSHFRKGSPSRILLTEIKLFDANRPTPIEMLSYSKKECNKKSKAE